MQHSSKEASKIEITIVWYLTVLLKVLVLSIRTLLHLVSILLCGALFFYVFPFRGRICYSFRIVSWSLLLFLLQIFICLTWTLCPLWTKILQVTWSFRTMCDPLLEYPVQNSTCHWYKIHEDEDIELIKAPGLVVLPL